MYNSGLCKKKHCHLYLFNRKYVGILLPKLFINLHNVFIWNVYNDKTCENLFLIEIRFYDLGIVNVSTGEVIKQRITGIYDKHIRYDISIFATVVLFASCII